MQKTQLIQSLSMAHGMCVSMCLCHCVSLCLCLSVDHESEKRDWKEQGHEEVDAGGLVAGVRKTWAFLKTQPSGFYWVFEIFLFERAVGKLVC